MEIWLTLITYIFDLFILYVYLTRTMGTKIQKLHPIIYQAGFIITECVLFACEFLTLHFHSPYSLYINTVISFLTTFGLCFFYPGNIRHKFFVSLTFQVFVLLSENILTLILQAINPEWLEITDFSDQITFLNLGSKCILLLLCLVFSLYWSIRIQQYTAEHQLLTFTTPLISLFILLSIPFHMLVENLVFLNFFRLLFISLVMLNIINYILLQKNIVSIDFRNRYQQMEQQIGFQKEKYKQLNVAYRETRRIVHDTKKHYFSIQKLIEDREYDKLSGYTHSAINSLEATYAKVNTGNLVIDAFVTNYWNLSTQEGIRFQCTIQVDPEQIPADDYDLCVILGNLLDNSLQACRNNPMSENHIFLQILLKDKDNLTIHVSNSYDKRNRMNRTEKEQIYHGFGVENVRRITESYNGIMHVLEEEDFEVYVVIPVI